MPLMNYQMGSDERRDPWLDWMWLGQYGDWGKVLEEISGEEWVLYNKALSVGLFLYQSHYAHTKFVRKRSAAQAKKLKAEYEELYRKVRG
jgi:hypothetical protein